MGRSNVTKVSGSDHCGGFRIGGEAKLNCNTSKQGFKTVKGIPTTEKSVDWHEASD